MRKKPASGIESCVPAGEFIFISRRNFRDIPGFRSCTGHAEIPGSAGAMCDQSRAAAGRLRP
ncbi:hypothetical protein, partial [Sphingopyxis sp.]|uniref:hypothetical protein n=1 Tax=Sphingopyxis sp. TaxID=1908224 RepID=UPI002ED8C176